MADRPSLPSKYVRNTSQSCETIGERSRIMKASSPGNQLTKAREEIQKTEIAVRDSERRTHIAQDMGRQAKLKFKQARKWARQTRKLVKKAKAEAIDKLHALERAVDWLKKLEKKAMKKSKKAHPKSKHKPA